MQLEWDETKRLKAIRERGLDFADVANFDPVGIETIPDRRFDYGEDRFITYGYLNGRLCLYCWTPRGSNVRIISMRKANERERKSYQERQGSGHS